MILLFKIIYNNCLDSKLIEKVGGSAQIILIGLPCTQYIPHAVPNFQSQSQKIKFLLFLLGNNYLQNASPHSVPFYKSRVKRLNSCPSFY